MFAVGIPLNSWASNCCTPLAYGVDFTGEIDGWCGRLGYRSVRASRCPALALLQIPTSAWAYLISDPCPSSSNGHVRREAARAIGHRQKALRIGGASYYCGGWKLIRLALFWLSPSEWMAQRVYTEIRRLSASAEIHCGTVIIGPGIRTSAVTAGKRQRQTQNSQALHCVFSPFRRIATMPRGERRRRNRLGCLPGCTR
jgi:hypothetical protein